ncbi:hypothetical protein ABB02_01117 [Clostridiaceae bacterium JG1575]|nr:hypothetical protein ABB02_01117 [Clostridiaceae bacterium JG1575]
MRRKDRMRDREFADRIIDEADHGVLCLASSNRGYGVPLSFVRAGDSLFFHCAKEGKKLDFIEENHQVQVVFAARVASPEPMERELLEKKIQAKGASSLLSQVFTTEFASVMAQGYIQEVQDPLKKRRALELLCRRFTPWAMEWFDLGADLGMDRTRIFEIHMEEVTAKEKKLPSCK